MDIAKAQLFQYENEDFDESPQWVDRGTGVGSDFTGSTFEMDIKDIGDGEGTPVASATIGLDDIAEGIIRIQVAIGIAVGPYTYDLVMITGSARRIIMTGDYVVEQGVTQP